MAFICTECHRTWPSNKKHRSPDDELLCPDCYDDLDIDEEDDEEESVISKARKESGPSYDDSGYGGYGEGFFKQTVPNTRELLVAIDAVHHADSVCETAARRAANGERAAESWLVEQVLDYMGGEVDGELVWDVLQHYLPANT